MNAHFLKAMVFVLTLLFISGCTVFVRYDERYQRHHYDRYHRYHHEDRDRHSSLQHPGPLITQLNSQSVGNPGVLGR